MMKVLNFMVSPGGRCCFDCADLPHNELRELHAGNGAQRKFHRPGSQHPRLQALRAARCAASADYFMRWAGL